MCSQRCTGNDADRANGPDRAGNGNGVNGTCDIRGGG